MNKTTIAVIDDHVLVTSGLASLIDTFDGFQVVAKARNGRDFIKQLDKSKAPDIILLDVGMPEMDGYQTAEWIRVNLPESKVLALSLMDNEPVIIRMLKHGARGFIVKDSETEVFREALTRIRDEGYYINDLVSSKMIHFFTGNDNTHYLPVHLTEREVEFLKLSCSDKTYKQIAREMHVGIRTVDGYRDSLFKKLGVNSRVGLVIYAIKNGFVVI